MRSSLFIYVTALGVATAAFPADLRADSDDVSRLAAGAATLGNPGLRLSATRATAELIVNDSLPEDLRALGLTAEMLSARRFLEQGR